MFDKEKFFIWMSTCNKEDFKIDFPDFTRRFDEKNILTIETDNPEAVVHFIDHTLGVRYVNEEGSYFYSDGSKAVWVKTQRCWKIKKRNKVLCKVVLK